MSEHGRPLRHEPRILTPSGIHSFEQPHMARVSDERHFHAWLVKNGLTAVKDPRYLPVVIRKGLPPVHLGPGIVDPVAEAKQLGGEPDEWWEFEPRAKLNDPFYSPLWHLHPSQDATAVGPSHIHAEDAWDITRGNNTIIAVGDDGISMVHEDLTPNFFGVAHDFFDNDDDPSPETGDGHGTRVSGVAAARGDNGIGATGVCPECRLLPMRLFTSNSGKYSDARLLGPASVVADAFRWAATQGARVINSSWGPAFSPVAPPQFRDMPGFVHDAITDLVKQNNGKGVLFVWAAGNIQNFSVAFDGWASEPRVFSVGSMNALAELSTNTVVGPPVRLLAPSADPGGRLPKIITTDLANDYSFNFTGTSAAAPVVAGVAALVLAKYPELTLAQLMEVLLDSAERVDTAHANYDREGESCTHGAGRVDAKAALDLAAARQGSYASGFTLRFELCGDGIDNDNNSATPDACSPCIPTNARDLPNGVDDDCDGYIDNASICAPPGKARCDVCGNSSECAADFVCAMRADGQRCLRDCSVDTRCAPGEQCTSGVCLPLRAGVAVECSAYSACTPTNNGVETCDNVDNDCDGVVDDIPDTAPEALSQRGKCLQGAVGVCNDRKATCAAGFWACLPAEQYRVRDDTCDGLDNNCDGRVDESAATDCPTKPIPEKTPVVTPKSGCAATAPEAWWIVLLALFFI